VVEEYQRLLDRLGEGSLRRVAELKGAGYTCPEIADQMGCSVSTVERKLRRIRGLLQGGTES
jgi:DNA-directed RNA polymerase specialized sigma24 family protein